MSEEIVGRDEELAALRDFLDEPALPSALLFAGEPGAGKTTLWRAGVEAARERSFRVLISSPAAAETQLAFGSLRDLLGDVLPEAAAGLPAPQRRALEVALFVEESEGSPPERGAIAAAFLGALRSLAEQGPLLLALDDAQWLDVPSAGVLEFAVRRFESEGVALLVSHRNDSKEPLGLERASLGTTRIDVGPLSSGALHHLLHTRLELSLSRPMLRRVLDISGGNPLYALELGRALGSNDELHPVQQLPLPRTLKEALRSRLDGLPQVTLDALLAVAVLAEATPSQIESVTDLEDAWTALDPALEGGVIEAENERLRFSHPMLASIITTQAHPRKLRALHRRIGLTLDDLEMRARHVAFAAEPPDAEAAELLEEAARRALQRGAPASAADLLEHAQRLTPGEDEEGWARRTVDAAFAHAEGGEEGRGQVLAREVIDRARPGPERARALGLLAYWLSDVDLCAVALGEAGEGSPLRPWLEYVRAYSHTMRAELGLGLEHGRIAVAAAEAAGDNDTLARALTTLAEIEGTMCAGDPFPRLRSALDLDEAARVPIILAPQTYLGRWLMRTDELDAAREVLEGQVLRVRELGGEELWPVLGYMLSELEWRAGNWDRAGEYARELEANFSLDDETVLGHEVAHWAQALVDAHRGRLDAARESAAAGVAAASAAGRTGWVIRNQALIGFVELSEGDYRAATATLGPLSAQLAEMGVRDPGVYLIAQNVIEALIGAGDLAGAEAEIAELEERGRALDRPWALSTAARCRGLLFAAQGDLDGALASLEQALVEHERLPMPFERARTLLALGQVRRRLKQRGAARQTLEEAKTIFEELGAVLWATKATDELARIGGRTASTSQLTPTEQRVAELVADGRSNKEVAAALFVTVKTVEANLSRVYAKLGIRSRGELATSLTASKM